MVGRSKDDSLIQAGLAAVVVVVIVLCGAALELHWSLSALSRAYEKNSAQIEAEANQAVNQRCVLLAGRDQEECVTKATKTAQQEERDEADLYAQRKMAEWAFWVGITAFISVFLSLIGILYIWRSIQLNREAVTVARETLIAQSRPWIKIDAVKFNKMWMDEDGLHIQANIKVANLGQSPAHGVSITPIINLLGPFLERSPDRSKPEEISGPPVFPGKWYPYEVSFSTTSDAAISRQMETERFLRKDKSEEYFQEIEKRIKLTGFETSIDVIVLVHYWFHGSEKVHKTIGFYSMVREASHNVIVNGVLTRYSDYPLIAIHPGSIDAPGLQLIEFEWMARAD